MSCVACSLRVGLNLRARVCVCVDVDFVLLSLSSRLMVDSFFSFNSFPFTRHRTQRRKQRRRKTEQGRRRRDGEEDNQRVDGAVCRIGMMQTESGWVDGVACVSFRRGLEVSRGCKDDRPSNNEGQQDTVYYKCGLFHVQDVVPSEKFYTELKHKIRGSFLFLIVFPRQMNVSQ